MDVKVMAFEISLGNGITMPTLYDHIVGTSNVSVDRRLLYLDQLDGWWRGLVLTSKDIKAFSKLIRERGSIRLSPEAIHDGELAHFNFFLVNATTGRGYFQYYHGSSSVNAFFYSLRKKYNELRDILIDIACREAQVERYNMPASIKRRFKGKLHCTLVLRRKSFAELMEELRYVKNLSIQFREYVPNQPLFRALALRAKSIKHRLVFGVQDDPSVLRSIVDLVHADVLKDLRGVGVANDDFERAFQLLNEPETLARFDFNDVVLETEFDSRDISRSMNNAPMLQRLREIANTDGWALR